MRKLPALNPHAQATADLPLDQSLSRFWSDRNPQVTARTQALERMRYLSPAVASHSVYTAEKLTLNGHPFPPVRPN